MRTDHNPAKPHPTPRKDREFDALTFLLAGVLALIIVGAIGYGILNSAKVAKNVPSPTAGLQKPNLIARPLPGPTDPAERATTGASGQSK